MEGQCDRNCLQWTLHSALCVWDCCVSLGLIWRMIPRIIPRSIWRMILTCKSRSNLKHVKRCIVFIVDNVCYIWPSIHTYTCTYQVGDEILHWFSVLLSQLLTYIRTHTYIHISCSYTSTSDCCMPCTVWVETLQCHIPSLSHAPCMKDSLNTVAWLLGFADSAN